MASALKNLSAYDESTIPDAGDMTFGIVVSEWNAEVTHALYQGCYDTLVKHGARPDKIFTVQVPGAFELPAGARILNGQQKLDVCICLGCVIKGATNHNEYINQAVAQGLTNLSIASGKPFIFGVLTPNTEEQAMERAGGKHGNKGVEAAVTAIRMAALKRSTPEGTRKIGF
ncbi:MAG: 6,7-dimethyl-8-ribityllumazine synthase [Bacteroidetes bacterium]|nr:MAG: 6,7-dimethyl-8-ribityllumazine synthase [Bacteroidota bacterium]